DAAERGERDQAAVDARADSCRAMKRRDEENESDGDNRDPLEDAEWAGGKPQHMLGVQCVADKRGTREKSESVADSAAADPKLHSLFILEEAASAGRAS